jgi:hypothetical protein
MDSFNLINSLVHVHQVLVHASMELTTPSVPLYKAYTYT